MQTEQFRETREILVEDGGTGGQAIMLAESVPWQCHQSLIADALVTKDWDIRHIMSETKVDAHAITSFAVIEHGAISYPAQIDLDRAARLF